jgi:hypothetical protein
VYINIISREWWGPSSQSVMELPQSDNNSTPYNDSMMCGHMPGSAKELRPSDKETS